MIHLPSPLRRSARAFERGSHPSPNHHPFRISARLILLTALTLLSLAASAQWTTTPIKADPLKGTKDDIAHTYTDTIAAATFTFWESSPDQYLITSTRAPFAVEAGYSQFSGRYSGINVIVGLYTSDGTLQEKLKMWLDISAAEGMADVARTRNAGKMSNPVGQAKKVKKILTHLTTTDGYIRIAATLHGGSDYDLTIPHL